MPSNQLEFDGPLQSVGENRHGWRFAVGQLGGRWVGLALGRMGDGTGYMHFFAEVSEGYHMGVPDRETAIRLTGGLAQLPDQGFGGIDVWHVPPELRGRPENLPRCGLCQRVGCEGECVDGY